MEVFKNPVFLLGLAGDYALFGVLAWLKLCSKHLTVFSLVGGLTKWSAIGFAVEAISNGGVMVILAEIVDYPH